MCRMWMPQPFSPCSARLNLCSAHATSMGLECTDRARAHDTSRSFIVTSNDNTAGSRNFNSFIQTSQNDLLCL